MKILGISSATKTISVGIIDGSHIVAELTFSGREAFTENLIVYIKKIIDESGITPEGIAVCEGPGSYSGLRGGLSVAKTLAQVQKLKVVGVSTLETIAYNLIDIEGTVASITHAKSDEFNFALFGISKRNIQRLTDDLLINQEKLIEKLNQIKGSITLCGEIERLPEISHKVAQNNIPRGSSVAFLGIPKFITAKKDSFFKLNAKYSHKPNIRTFSK
ncbi:MAG: tRNA (adenosine(37)-N6)-threonylcarbamoyltransferase complex dimerization subunit type 1 TsaB [Candidatus Saganbacteria bacterium]|nr:tRNA (adenosine(37)-N6)-threonylcarbamoyltransferase complex dimerization subunit type 1 TsaB [Candidatus Saganbacteria bacterium]